MNESHLISWHAGFHGRNYILHGMIVVDHPLWEKLFRCRTYTGGQHSSEAVIVKKTDMWP